ncbi:pyrimidine-nucleoside phosphorylase [Neomoorella mulderi]|uniref:Pyrimidine-nucleoside phosphorylase n=1 Tax=Moorella mulderi DSM 14980 TaxID=1122241 RepID=A0A151B0R6_9FIRM|nr:pyrimidine-nucleoside phosphorylase [Moorella mulderi]KYH33488.1 pyrimidine-nucleoside phosphorylase [Moorella mulderi DSM 14980]
MQMLDLIRRKREGQALTPAEIEAMIQGYTAGTIPDYQMAAFLMAVYFRGLDRKETAALTRAMVASGERIDWSSIPGVKVDKHSTGGVADTTTLVLAPLVAAAGVPVVKMSGRGLGHTGGTIDKLESIPGFRVQLSREDMVRQVKEIGLAITAQTGKLAPADGKLYALRDVTATVESIPLIASSVMSKKIAAGAEAIVLDVKVGSGAFMPDLESARKLARIMVDLGREMGRRVVAVITNMDEPLGMMVGNALEVREALNVLRGGGPRELREVCLTLGSQMLLLAGAAGSNKEGRRLLENLLAGGQGLKKFQQFIAAQGGDPEVVDNPQLLPQAGEQVTVAAPAGGYISAVQARLVGEAALLLGAGRLTKESPIDLAVGIELKKRRGEYIHAGEPLAVFHVNDRTNLEAARERFLAAYTLAPEPPAPQPLVYEIIK